MIELEDVGRDVLLTYDSPPGHQTERKVMMVIKAPRGTMALFDTGFLQIQDWQCRAIKAFVEEHLHD